MTAATAFPSAFPSAFPWDAVLHLTLGRLGWPPDAVWRATPREVAAALGRAAGHASMRGVELQALLAAFPDETSGA